MKKLLIIIILFLLTLTLVGCGFSIKPVITLNGNETVYVEYEGEYTELGATYTDNRDDPGDAIIGGDTVDSSVLGTYLITYNITDSDKNEAIEVIRTVIVQDTTPPVITLTGEETIYVEYEDVYEEQGATFTDNYDGLGLAIVGGDIVDSSVLGSYIVTYNKTDSNNNEATEITRTVVVQDTTPPVITLTGEETVFVEYAGIYIEQGAIFNDNYDTSGEIIVGGEVVDSFVLGSYIITYNTTDSNGNIAIEVTRTVIVQDTLSPGIILNGDEIIYVEYEESYLEQGAIFIDNYDESGEVIIGGDTIDSSVLGTYIVTYNAVDSNTNEAIEIIRTVIVQDTTNPVITLIGADTVYVEYGDPYLELGATFTDNYDDLGVVIVDDENVNLSELGTYTVTYNSTDSNGNTASEITRTVVVQDTTSPEIILTGDENIYLDNNDEYIELGAIFTDNYDVSGEVIIGGDIVNTNISGIYYVTYNYTDSNDNAAVEVTRKVVVGDIVPPVISNLPTFYTIDRGVNIDFISTFNITAIDDIDGNLLSELLINYTNTHVLQPGNYTVTFEVSDFSGNKVTEYMTLIVTEDSSNLSVDFANLVVFIRFSDETSYTSPLSFYEIADMFNDTNMSLQDYYLEVSNNDFKILSYFTDNSITYYTDTYPRGYYEPYSTFTNTIGYQTDEEKKDREYALLEAAINYIEDNNLIDSGINLDMDNDGKIDNISFLVSNDIGEWGDLLWPHRYSMWDSIDSGYFHVDAPSINGNYAFDYTFQLLGENNVVSEYFSLGILAHELFHVIGAPDLYHYYIDEEISPVGYWDIMDGTNAIPNHMLLYMKEAYGKWNQDLLEVFNSGIYSFNVSTSTTNNGMFIDLGYSNEYLYMEYRNNTGDYESSLYDSGIIFYRVDQDFTGNSDGMYVEPGLSEDEIFLFRSGVIFDSTYLLEDRYIVEDDGYTDDGVMNSTTFQSIGEGTNVPLFFSDGTEISISISLVTISGDTATVSIIIN